MPHHNDDVLAALLNTHAARLPVSDALRDEILASAPGAARRLDAVLGQVRRLPVPRALSQRILAAAPAAGILASLWPFGPVWRPAAYLAAAAIFGVVLGASDAVNLRGEVSISGALSEEVFVLAFSVNELRPTEDLEWPE
jgi:hypothetical protein